MTWTISDDMPAAKGMGIAADSSGNIYSSGQGDVAADGTGFFLAKKLQGPR